MCVTDLELDPDLDQITEDEQEPGLSPPGPGSQHPQPVGGQAPGVAWGRAGQRPAAG